MDAAYNLARWLTKNDQDADDVVQESYLRALRFYSGFRGGDPRAWLLAIVRNTCYTWMRQNRMKETITEFNDELHGAASGAPTPETILIEQLNAELLHASIEQLPVEFREVLVLRELEGMSYKEIASIVSVPVGTVMSRLSRARKQLQDMLTEHTDKED
jgi:RNA polymerase sigma-70 factor (ECF subfamily)